MARKTKPTVPIAAPQARPKQFDSRILDRMDGRVGAYRYWLTGDHEMPAAYASEQRETCLVELKRMCLELAAALGETPTERIMRDPAYRLD